MADHDGKSTQLHSDVCSLTTSNQSDPDHTRPNMNPLPPDQRRLNDEDNTKDEDNNHHVLEMSSVDILRIKNKFLENIEELRMLRVSECENAQRITGLVSEKHEIERNIEDAFSVNKDQEEQHARDLDDIRKQMQQKIHKLESDKNQTNMKTDIWEKEVKSLKEQLKLLLVEKYSMEKTIKEQDHRIQMLSSSAASHMVQMKDLEGRCKELIEEYGQFSTQLTNLSSEVKCASDMNHKLSRVNTHQKCIIDSLTEDNKEQRDEIVKMRVEWEGQSHDGETNQNENKTKIQRLEEIIAQKMKVTEQLEKKLKEIKEEQQHTMKALSESHLLTDRHLDSSLKSAEDNSRLKDDLKETKMSLEAKEAELTKSLGELADERKQRELKESKLKNQLQETETALDKLQSDREGVSKAYHNMEELNSSWAKKNMELNVNIEKLTKEIKEKDNQIHSLQLQCKPETKEAATSTHASTEEKGIMVDIIPEPEQSEMKPEPKSSEPNTFEPKTSEPKTSEASSSDDMKRVDGTAEGVKKVSKCDGVETRSSLENDKRNSERVESKKSESNTQCFQRQVKISGPEYLETVKDSGPEYLETVKDSGPEYLETVKDSGPEYLETVKDSGQEYLETVKDSTRKVAKENKSGLHMERSSEQKSCQVIVQGIEDTIERIESGITKAENKLLEMEETSRALDMPISSRLKQMLTPTTTQSPLGPLSVTSEGDEVRDRTITQSPLSLSITNEGNAVRDRTSTLQIPIPHDASRHEHQTGYPYDKIDAAARRRETNLLSPPPTPILTSSQTKMSPIVSTQNNLITRSPLNSVQINNNKLSPSTNAGTRVKDASSATSPSSKPKSSTMSPESSFRDRFKGLSHLIYPSKPWQAQPLKDRSRFSFTLPPFGPTSSSANVGRLSIPRTVTSETGAAGLDAESCASSTITSRVGLRLGSTTPLIGTSIPNVSSDLAGGSTTAKSIQMTPEGTLVVSEIPKQCLDSYRMQSLVTSPVPSMMSTDKGSSTFRKGIMFSPKDPIIIETLLSSNSHQLYPSVENDNVVASNRKTADNLHQDIGKPSSDVTVPYSKNAPGTLHQDIGKPPGGSSSRGNSQEDWPDFAEEFSMESNPEELVADGDRPSRKRRSNTESLFSDDEDDPKQGVASQIDRIQAFLKTDRLKRPKRHNKEPVV